VSKVKVEEGMISTFLASWEICETSSLVGARTRQEGATFNFGTEGVPWTIICCTIGTKKAAVFPDPVWAQARRSLFRSTVGIENL